MTCPEENTTGWIRGGYTNTSFLSDDVACKLVNFTQTTSTFVSNLGMYHRKTNKYASKSKPYLLEAMYFGENDDATVAMLHSKTHCASKPLDEIIENRKNTANYIIKQKKNLELSALTTQLKINVTTFLFINSLSSY